MVAEMRAAEAENIAAHRAEEREMRSEWCSMCREMRRAKP